MDFFSTWLTSVFLQASMQSWFWNPIIVRWKEILEWTRGWKCCKSTFIGQNFDRMSTNISDRALLSQSPNQTLRSRDCTHPYRTLTIPGNPSQWISCLAYHPQIMATTTFLVTIWNQAHQIHFLPSPNWWPDRGGQSDGHSHLTNVQLQKYMHMGWHPSLCAT